MNVTKANMERTVRAHSLCAWSLSANGKQLWVGYSSSRQGHLRGTNTQD